MGLEQKRFFNLREQTIDGGTSDGGNMNLFPIDLSGCGKIFDGARNPLRLEIQLTEPALTDIWYLGSSHKFFFEHPYAYNQLFRLLLHIHMYVYYFSGCVRACSTGQVSYSGQARKSKIRSQI